MTQIGEGVAPPPIDVTLNANCGKSASLLLDKLSEYS